jgi:hypothetical protein
MRYLALPMQRNFRKPITNGLDRNDAYTVTSLDDLAKIYAKPLYAPRCQALIICLEKACSVLDEYLTRFLQLGQTKGQEWGQRSGVGSGMSLDSTA